jgi:hypothetical protein
MEHQLHKGRKAMRGGGKSELSFAFNSGQLEKRFDPALRDESKFRVFDCCRQKYDQFFLQNRSIS